MDSLPEVSETWHERGKPSSAVALAHHCKPACFSSLPFAHRLHSKRLSTMKAETNKQGKSFTFRGSKQGRSDSQVHPRATRSRYICGI